MSCICTLFSCRTPTWSCVKESIVAHKKIFLLVHTILSSGSVYAAATFLSPPISIVIVTIGGVNLVVDLAAGIVMFVDHHLPPPPPNQERLLDSP